MFEFTQAHELYRTLVDVGVDSDEACRIALRLKKDKRFVSWYNKPQCYFDLKAVDVSAAEAYRISTAIFAGHAQIFTRSRSIWRADDEETLSAAERNAGLTADNPW